MKNLKFLIAIVSVLWIVSLSTSLSHAGPPTPTTAEINLHVVVPARGHGSDFDQATVRVAPGRELLISATPNVASTCVTPYGSFQIVAREQWTGHTVGWHISCDNENPFKGQDYLFAAAVPQGIYTIQASAYYGSVPPGHWMNVDIQIYGDVENPPW